MPAGMEQQSIDMGASMETEEGLAIIDVLNEVSDVLAMAGPQVTFVGAKMTTIEPAGRLQGVDVFSCPRGWFILFREPTGPHWSVANEHLDEALADIHEEDLRALVHRRLQQAGLP
ncbi:MAG: hypothetical protein ACRDI2_06730 [Chloroflexota bacterium]